MERMLKTALQESGTQNQVKSWIYIKNWRVSETINTGKIWNTSFLLENMSLESRMTPHQVCKKYQEKQDGHSGPRRKQHRAWGQPHGSRESWANSPHSSPSPCQPMTLSPQVLPWPQCPGWCYPELSPAIPTHPCPASHLWVYLATSLHFTPFSESHSFFRSYWPFFIQRLK